MSKTTGQIYNGDVKITKDNQKEWEEKLKDTVGITGDLCINSNVTLPKLTRVGGDLSIYSKTLDKRLVNRLYKKYGQTSKWYLSDTSPKNLLERKFKTAEYRINNIIFDVDLFYKVYSCSLSAKEVFAITNTEQRRIAYERMDKRKMVELNATTIEESVDAQGNKQRIISFVLEGFTKPFIFYNCVCPSTKREYFLQTDKLTCAEAKASSFGLTVQFDEEY